MLAATDASDSRGSKTMSQTSSSQTSTFPKKELAILLNIVEELKLHDYVVAVGNIIGPKNITFASRISNNRVCIYLNSVNLVNMIVENHSNVVINGYDISIRKLITPARRLLISNVCPSIPNNVIENTIRSIGLRPVSPMSFLRAGLTGDEYNHILSFRRQIYVQPDDAVEFASSMIIKYEEVNYRIYLTYDSLTCFICKKANHIARYCPTANASAQGNIVNNPQSSQYEIQGTGPIQSNNMNVDLQVPDTDLTTKSATGEPLEDIPRLPCKRAGSQISDASLPTNDNQERPTSVEFVAPLPRNQDPSDSNSRQNKRLKKSNSTEDIKVEELMLPVKKLIDESPSISTLNFNQLVDFFENVHGSPDIVSIAQLYTSDFKGLISTLNNIYPLLSHRTLKARCTRIKKKLYHYLDITTESNASDGESVASQSSY